MGLTIPPSARGLEPLFDGRRDGGIDELRAALATIVGDSADLVGDERLKKGIHRLRFTGGARGSLVVKRLDPVVAHRSRVLEERWLPAAGLSKAGPGLLATVFARTGDVAWQVLRDLGNRGLDGLSHDEACVQAAVETIARLHRRFTEHSILAEVRLWGGDLGAPWYVSNVRDALRCIEALDAGQHALPERTREARERLIARLKRFGAEARERTALIARLDGQETLLHGDLWTKNVFALPAAASGTPIHVRLIDWDHAAVGPITYDLSTFLMRFESPRRAAVLAAYEEALGRDGPRLTREEWNRLFDTAETARIANRVIWPALALLRDDARLRDWALDQLVEVDSWFETLGPVLEASEGAM